MLPADFHERLRRKLSLDPTARDSISAVKSLICDHQLSIEKIDPAVIQVNGLKNSNEMTANNNHMDWKDLNEKQSMVFAPKEVKANGFEISNEKQSPSNISVESKQGLIEMESRNHILKEGKPDLLNNNLFEESKVKFNESPSKQNHTHYIKENEDLQNLKSASLLNALLKVKSEPGIEKLYTNKISSETNEDQKTYERVLELANEYMNTDFKIDLNELYLDCYNEKLSKDWIKAVKFNVTIEYKKKMRQISYSTEMNIKEEITQGSVESNTLVKQISNLTEIKEEITKAPIENNTQPRQISNLTNIKNKEEISKGPVENNTELMQTLNSTQLNELSNKDKTIQSPVKNNNQLRQTSNSTELNELNNEDKTIQSPVENNTQLKQTSYSTELNELNNKDEMMQSPIENSTQQKQISNLTKMIVEEKKSQIDDTLIMEETLSDPLNDPSLCFEPGILTVKDIPTSFWITIHRADGFSEIWGQILEEGYYENMIKLATDMQNFYETRESCSIKAAENSYYALKQDVWHRVKCTKLEKEKAHIIFIDRGDIDVVDVDKLQPLVSEFTVLPAQGINIRLTPLELFSDLAEANTILKEHLVETDVFVEVAATKNYPDYLSVLVEEMQLENGKSTTDQDNFTNLVPIISHKIYKLLPGPIAQVKLNETFEARVTHICKPNGLYIQLCSKSFEYFNNLMIKATPKLDAFPIADELPNLDANRLYFAKNEAKIWCRVKILKLNPNNTIEAFFIDIGYIKLVRRSGLILINKIDKMMEKYPAQALFVKLDQIDTLDEEVINCLESLATPEDVVHVTFKTAMTNENPTPKVEMFKKTNDFLASINSTLILRKKTSNPVNIPQRRPKSYSRDESTESLKISTSSSDLNNSSIQKSDESNKTKLSFKKSISNEISKKKLSIDDILPAVKVPPEGSFFDCYVVRASHPSCFIIQILRNKAKLLSNLVRDVSVICNNYKGKELSFESVEIGTLYACKSDDEYWHRAYVIKKSSPKEVVVYFCDDGYHKTVGAKNLIPLDKQYFKLPYQAIWAQLHGVKPTSPTWSPTDSLKFRDMIQGKNIVCDIRSKTRVTEENEDGPSINKYLYQVELYDTSTAEDVNIADLLVNQGMCTRC
ncbi:hypothetical protein TKK_0007464 [Trichogramma kaykai]|uniref:Tudor domain-containing protein n=1 Tax=Trichogramma kaykai TaxID=54128 RepID=A0ABD2WGS8_9HYME